MNHQLAAKRAVIGVLVLAVQWLLGGAFTLSAQYPDGQTILTQIDQNLSSRTRVFTSRMIIHGRRGSRSITSKTWAEGEDRAFTEYLSPAREKGTKMLKLEDKLWIYSPSTDRIIRISGHMLRQSVMGSDLSYEDMMENQKLTRYYRAEVTGRDRLRGRDCWRLELTATSNDVAYHFRKLWVDCERLIPLREELFARSGKLLKQTDLFDIQQLQGRWFPRRILFKDVLKQGEGTEFIVDEIRFDVPIPPYRLSKAVLRK